MIARVSVGITAAIVFAVGAFRVSTTDDAPDGWGLMAVGLVLVGIAISLELFDRFRR